MNSFLDTITSPTWWTGVVAVGISINLVSAYLKPRLDTALASVSTSWGTRTEKKRQQRASRVDALRIDPHAQLLAGIDELRRRIRSVTSYVLGGLSLGIALLIEANHGSDIVVCATSLTGLFNICFGVMDHIAANQVESELSDARKEPLFAKTA